MFMNKKLFSAVLAIALVFAFSSCGNILSSLGSLGSALDKSGTNVLGYNSSASTKQANDAVDKIFGEGDDSIFSSPSKDKDGNPDGGTKLDKIKDGLDGILDKVKPTDDGGLTWSQDEADKLTDGNGKVDYDKLMDTVLDSLVMDDDSWNDIKNAIGSLTTDEAQEKFAQSMRESAGLNFDGTVIEGKNIKEYTDALKEELIGDGSSIGDDNIKNLLSDTLDALVTPDGEFTKGSLLVISSVATVMDKVKKRADEKGSDFDLDNMSDDMAKDSLGDFLDLTNVTMAVLGPKSSVAQSLGKIMDDKVKK